MQNNYRVDVFYKAVTLIHYKIEFPEKWLAMSFAKSLISSAGIDSIYLLERVSDQVFDIKQRIM